MLRVVLSILFVLAMTEGAAAQDLRVGVLIVLKAEYRLHFGTAYRYKEHVYEEHASCSPRAGHFARVTALEGSMARLEYVPADFYLLGTKECPPGAPLVAPVLQAKAWLNASTSWTQADEARFLKTLPKPPQ